MGMVDFQLEDGGWIYVNPNQIAALSDSADGGTQLHINGTVFRLESSLNMVKQKLRELDIVIP